MVEQATCAEVDLTALSHNLNIVRKKTGNKKILAVVKANAYGHGAVEVARRLITQDVSMLGVAFTKEALALREAGINVPIQIFFDRDNIDTFFRHNLTPTILDIDFAKKISDKAQKLRRSIAAHVKVDTGMGRVGFDIRNAAADIVKISQMKNIKIEGLMSHFSDADLDDKDFANRQLADFLALRQELEKKNLRFQDVHISNSAAVLSMPDAHLTMVRPGIMLYGYGNPQDGDLKPVLSLKSKVLFLKEVPSGTPISYGRTFVTKRKSTIATIPIGYADGYSRKLSNAGEVLINERRAPVIGRVCMDTIMVDVTDIPTVKKNAEVVLIGKQGKEKITAEEIADKTGTISYEVLTSIGQRVKRVYLD